ncbi:hypothetical protein ACRAQ7_10955 [Erythrobacter sp. W53]|uniref:hypothetical protein n=1 Tax=Erythrobacteraceae TaxID=335929 RepID=UPI0036D26CB2
MTAFEILFYAGLAFGLPAFLFLAFIYREQASFWIAAVVFAGFLGFTALTVAQEGVLGFMPNHTTSLWGVQVWYDLVIAIALALTFIVPRARAAGMKPAPWVIACACTGGVGLLAMVTRLLWLERAAAHQGR